MFVVNPVLMILVNDTQGARCLRQSMTRGRRAIGVWELRDVA